MDIAFADYLRFLFALIFVLGLILGVALIAKRFGFGNQAPMRLRGPKRLAIIESMALDAKHRLVLVRRDQTEHLILIGGASELVVETNIAAPTSTTTAVAEAQS